MNYQANMYGKTYTAKILDMHDGTYSIVWPFGFEDDEYRFKTIKGAERRLERAGFVKSEN